MIQSQEGGIISPSCLFCIIKDCHHARSQRRRIGPGARFGPPPYILKNVGGVYSCTCPAWRNQSLAHRTPHLKHLRAYRGEQAERERLGSATPAVQAVAKDKARTAAPKLLLAHPGKTTRT